MPALLSLVAAAALATAASPHAQPTPATPAREIAPGIFLVDERDRDMTMPSLSVTPGERAADGARGEWADTARCDPRGHREDGNLCLQYFLSGLKVPIRMPYVNHGAVLPRLKTADGATLSTLEISTYGRTLPDGSRIESVDVESELATRLKSPWGSESIYPHLYLQELVGGTCNCVAGLRRVAANGQVLWAWSYYWHPRGDAEAAGKVVGDPIPEPLIAFNEFAVPQRGSVALASSTATLFGHAAAGAGSRWPKLIVSIDVGTGQPTSHLPGFQPVSFEDLMQFAQARVDERLQHGLIDEADTVLMADGRRRDIYIADDFGEQLDAWVLKHYPSLAETWAP